MKRIIISVLQFILAGFIISGQTTSSGQIETGSGFNFKPGGFIRGGFYSWVDKSDDKPYVPTAFSDFGINLYPVNTGFIKAFADVRFRYGSEFLKPVNKVDLREAWIEIIGNKWDLTAGQKIIKWGRTDFTNPTSNLSSLNTVLRSPDKEDMNMANLLASINIYPFEALELEAVVVPFYRSSVLVIDPFPLPANVVINELPDLLTDKEMFSYGLKTEFHFRMTDWSISFFDGYDPMPGVALTAFSLDLSQPIPLPGTELSVKPYRNRVIGTDIETIIGSMGLRGEAAWSIPLLSHDANEYVPMPEIEWVAGADWSWGHFLFSAEYNGKYIVDFISSGVDPFIGTEPDYSELAELMSNPGFNLEDYVVQQVAAFNRLYNNQLKQFYHSFGFRIEAEALHGKVLPSLFSMYNFTSRDLLIIPEFGIKPADAFTVKVGAEIYKGPEGSLYDLIDDFMTGIYVSLRFDF